MFSPPAFIPLSTFAKSMCVVIFGALVTLLYVVFAVPSAGFGQKQAFLIWVFITLIILFAAANVSFPSLAERYAGAVVGAIISMFFFGAIAPDEYQRTSPFILFLIATVPALLLHFAWRWWNKQDFVIKAKQEKLLAKQQAEAEEQRRQREAEEVARIQAVQPVASAQPEELSDAAKQLAAELEK